jgi:hypothetical protein
MNFTRCCTLLILAAVSCAPHGYPIHLPSATIDPTITDAAFVQRVHASPEDEPFVCIVRFEKSLTDEEKVALGNRALILKGSRHDTWFLYANAVTVSELLEDPGVVWAGEYKSEYKMGRRADTIGEEARWMHVVSFAGGHPDFVADLHDIGFDDVRYDSILDEFHVYANAAQIAALTELWWVREIYRAGGRGLGRLMG